MKPTSTLERPATFRMRAPIAPRRPCPIPVRSPASIRRSLRAKRLIDLTLSLLLAIVAVPVVVVAAILVRLTSRGPAFYSQDRVGRFGRIITIIKLRSMYHNCERQSGPQWSTPGDPRITPLGRILRATHVDELPQLINVLRGEMSLVGPRPERPEIAAKLNRELDGYDLRSVVLPGITGHAQVHLPPDVTLADVRDKLRFDFAYVRRLTAWFDVVTLWRTGLKVIGLRRFD
jgi:lipopolysaccharide/colanic/teichoic acid biosynthesis glycosyltransferase